MTNQGTKGDFQNIKIGSKENDFKKKELNKKKIKSRYKTGFQERNVKKK